jgi:hypothetical protein
VYVTQANSCDLPNSETPLTQAQIDAQNKRISRTGSRFVRGNQDLGDLCNNLTPPAPSGSCDDLTSSLAMLTSGVFPVPPGTSGGASPLTASAVVAPSIADIVAAIQGGLAAPADGTPQASSTDGSSPTPAGTVVTTPAAPATPAVVNGNPGGLQICLPRMFTPGGLSGLRGRGFGGRGFGGRGFGGRGLGDYLMPGALRLVDGTTIADPANTPPTPAQCLPYQCGADPSNQAARYWCSYYGRASTRPPCTDPSCAPWKPSYCTAAPPPSAPAPVPAPTVPVAVYPYGALQLAVDGYVPARCNGGAPVIPGGVMAAANPNSVCFSLTSPLLWGAVAALGLGIWAMGKGRG